MAKQRSILSHNLTDGDAVLNIQLVREIANLKGIDETELEALYSTIDDMIKQLYSSPPSPHAQTELTFVYQEFRITLYQNGAAVVQEQPADPIQIDNSSSQLVVSRWLAIPLLGAF